MKSLSTQILGWKSNKQIIVLESDDWGSERFPNIETIKKFTENGYNLKKCGFSRFDCLELNDDVILLLEMFDKLNHQYSKNIKITLLCNTANPDISLIDPNDINSFKSISVKDKISSESNRNNILKYQLEGYRKGIFDLQYHGRQHIYSNRWMRDLVAQKNDTLFAFNNNVWGISKSYTKSPILDYRASYDIDIQSDIISHHNELELGLNEFYNSFGFFPVYFVAPNGHLPLISEKYLYNRGIKYINLAKVQSLHKYESYFKLRVNWMGKIQNSKLITITRNVGFEPISPVSGSIDRAIQKIALSFKFNNPVVISTHRANYVSGISELNRKNGLLKLNKLLISIMKLWPDVIFLTSPELGEVISGKCKVSDFY